jgi:hypothetical protein
VLLHCRASRDGEEFRKSHELPPSPTLRERRHCSLARWLITVRRHPPQSGWTLTSRKNDEVARRGPMGSDTIYAIGSAFPKSSALASLLERCIACHHEHRHSQPAWQ